jgi:hypothetical protein
MDSVGITEPFLAVNETGSKVVLQVDNITLYVRYDDDRKAVISSAARNLSDCLHSAPKTN